MNEPIPRSSSESASMKSASNGWRTFGIVVITVVLTLGVGYWLLTTYVFPDKFTPVVLNQKEQRVLDQKLQRVGVKPSRQQTLKPEPYSEAGASRTVSFSEKELNSMLARNKDLANKLAIDLSDNLASALLLVELDPTFPVIGGQTLKVTAGMELSLAKGKPSAILKGVSIWGVPLPNAWLGNMKNVDLFTEFGQAGGFWQAIQEGVESIEVKEGKLQIKLKE